MASSSPDQRCSIVSTTVIDLVCWECSLSANKWDNNGAGQTVWMRRLVRTMVWTVPIFVASPSSRLARMLGILSNLPASHFGITNRIAIFVVKQVFIYFFFWILLFLFQPSVSRKGNNTRNHTGPSLSNRTFYNSKIQFSNESRLTYTRHIPSTKCSFMIKFPKKVKWIFLKWAGHLLFICFPRLSLRQRKNFYFVSLSVFVSSEYNI